MSVTIDCTPKCGEPVQCATCGRTKAPIGRSVPLAAAGGYCDDGCSGYDNEPRAGHLWPGEYEESMRRPAR